MSMADTACPFRTYAVLDNLRHVYRWSRSPVLFPQSVMVHSYQVAVLAGAFARELLEGGIPIDRAACIEGGLWHDATEAITSDLPADVKWVAGKAAMDRLDEMDEDV